MKIGIVTQQLIGNYGGLLQNFALQAFLRGLGHEPVTIDYREPFMSRKEYRRRKWRWLRRTLKFKHPEPVGPRFRQRNSAMTNRFVRHNIATTRPVTEYSDPRVLKEGFRTLIVGSDQVWRPEYNWGVMTDMFLQFAQNWDVKRIAYAASFGTADKEYDDKLVAELLPLAKKFDAVSVREERGRKLAADYFGLSPEWVADPTLLIDREVYSQLADRSPVLKAGVLKYVLDSSDEINRGVERFSGDLTDNTVVEIGDKDMNFSIEDWLKSIRDAGFVFTDSFHGTLFSIIFHTPFIAFVNEARGAERFRSLLTRLGLEGRLVAQDAPAEEIVKIAAKPVSWQEADRKLDAFRQESKEFLETALGTEN